MADNTSNDDLKERPSKSAPRRRIWVVTTIIAVLIVVGLAVGLGVGLTVGRNNNSDDDTGPDQTPGNSTSSSNSTSPVLGNNTTFAGWRPTAGTSWQINLINSSSVNASLDVQVFDLDLFDTPISLIDQLHSAGRKVICYFSAGSYEDFRSDSSNFTSSDYGNPLDGWPGEWWLNTRLTSVRNNMLYRLDVAQQKGCDGVDPDNIDGYNSDTGLDLTEDDAVDYLNFLATNAHSRNLAIGIKNGGDIVNRTISNMQWEVNESCEQYDECDTFQPFIEQNKPVFHIEYPGSTDSATVQSVCSNPDIKGFSTLIKDLDLDNFFIACK
jgi:hypothetical protein